MQLPVYNSNGNKTRRSVELDDVVFGLKPNDHAIWLDVRATQAAARQGTHSTKERNEVVGSTRKLYRQKGTGLSRAGDAKSPIRRGGGTAFGPKPHAYKVGVNRKTRQLARRSALSYKLGEEAVRVIEDVNIEEPKTREVADLLAALEVEDTKVLMLTGGPDDVLYRSGRNISKLEILPAVEASTFELMKAKTVLLFENAVEGLTEALRPAEKLAFESASDDA